MTQTTKQRPTIAFFVNALVADYTTTLCRGIIDAAEDNDVNLIVVPGETINMDYEGQYNYNVIYEFVYHHNVDALVMVSSVLCQCISKVEFEKFCLRYKPIPLISIGMPIKGFLAVLVNSRTGLKQITAHLVKVHHRRRIAFMKGPEGHSEADERFLVYQEALKENGLDYDPELVIQGDFTVHSVKNAVETLLDERRVTFDAIMAANDVMAFQIIDFLRERKIYVPDEVSVTGFDDGEGAKYSNPSLSTVRQPIYESTKKAVEIALEFIENACLQENRPANVVLDTEMMIRESCGCLSESMQLYDSRKLVCVPESSVKDDLEPDEIIGGLIDQNLGSINTDELSFLLPFFSDCFRLFA